MKVETLIAGGGVAGLACARELFARDRHFMLVEREQELGGLCRSVSCGGYTFDYTGHFLHFKNAATRDWVLSLAPGVFKPRTRRAAVYSRGTLTEYPYQENSAGLPSAVALENVSGYLEAALRRAVKGTRREAQDFRSWCLSTFGAGIARNFLFPYNRKLWKFPLQKLTNRWMGRFVPQPPVLKVVGGALTSRPSDSGYNASFFYPDKGGISVLPQLLAKDVPGIFKGVKILKVDLERRCALLSTGFTVEYKHLVTSLPLKAFVQLCSGVPAGLKKAASRLKVVSVYNINFGLKTAQPVPYSWVYFPEEEFRFHRAGSVSACVPSVAPQGRSTLYLEYSYRGKAPDARKLGREAVKDLKKIGWIASDRDIAVRADLDLAEAYALYDAVREDAVGSILSFLEKKGVSSVGRYGRWEYGTMESAIEQGREAAQS
jgi:protoporphyrinogen oxidase